MLMAWFRANPAKDKAEDKAARSVRVGSAACACGSVSTSWQCVTTFRSQARPPKPPPVSNNKYASRTGDRNSNGKAKWWGL